MNRESSAEDDNINKRKINRKLGKTKQKYKPATGRIDGLKRVCDRADDQFDHDDEDVAYNWMMDRSRSEEE